MTTQTNYQSFDIKNLEEEVINRLVKLTGLTAEEVSECLEATRNQKKSDFTLQLGKIIRKKPDLLKNLEIKPDEIFTEVTKSETCLFLRIDKALFCKKIVDSILASETYEYEKKASESKYYGAVDFGKGETACIEHSSPNIAKKFHAGHLRTSIIGNSLVHLYRFLNFNVVRINHLGDWGKQFGVVGVGFNKYGNEEELEKDPIKHLLDVYVKINNDLAIEVEELKTEQDPNVKSYERLDKHSKIDAEAKQYFSNLEKGKPEEVKDWSRFRNLSVKQYDKLYKMLNIEFDDQLGESFYALQGLDNCIDDATMDEKGNYLYELGPLGNFVVKKSNGSTLYSTRDIAAVEYRVETYKPKKIIYVVAAQQDLHFQRLFSIARGEYGLKRRIPEDLELIHVNFGMINNLSTRKGNLVPSRIRTPALSLNSTLCT